MNQNGYGLDNININFNAKAINNKTAKSAIQHGGRSTVFGSTLAKYLSVTEESVAGAKVPAKTAPLSTPQLFDRMRVDSASTRLQLITALLQKKEDDEKPYDAYLKCLDIARRIMHGKKVTAEEMRFLLANEPGLYFIAILLRQPDIDSEENERAFDDECESLGIPLAAGAASGANLSEAAASDSNIAAE